MSIDNSADIQIFYDYSEFNLPTGLMIRQRFARSSTGTDYGDLVPQVTSSAQITFLKLAGHPYGA